jgi:serine protease Do
MSTTHLKPHISQTSKSSMSQIKLSLFILNLKSKDSSFISFSSQRNFSIFSQWTYTLLVLTALCIGMSTHVWADIGSNGFTHVAKKSIPAVVAIKISKKSRTSNMSNFEEEFLRHFFGKRMPQSPGKRGSRPRAPQEEASGQGSGFIISKDGYILTNNHVVGGADKIEVKLNDGRSFEAKLIGADAKSDVAIIKVDGDNLPTLELGDSESLEIGEWVIAVGNPFGLSATLTVGVVSAKGRANMGITDYEDFIQTDAAINPGNSGGPLVNTKGQVVGINTAIYSRSGGYMGIGFAIPIKMALKIKKQLIAYGEVRRGKIGVYIQEVNADIARQLGVKQSRGVLIADVIDGSSAQAGGMKAGDIVVEMGGEKIDSAADFRNKVSLTSPGNSINLKVIRQGKMIKLTLKIDAMNQKMKHKGRQSTRKKKTKKQPLETFGLQVEDLSSEVARRLNLRRTRGVVITDVKNLSPADQAGLKAGQVILSVNQEDLKSMSTLKHVMSSAGDTVLLRVRMERGVRFIVLSK